MSYLGISGIAKSRGHSGSLQESICLYTDPLKYQSLAKEVVSFMLALEHCTESAGLDKLVESMHRLRVSITQRSERYSGYEVFCSVVPGILRVKRILLIEMAAEQSVSHPLTYHLLGAWLGSVVALYSSQDAVRGKNYILGHLLDFDRFPTGVKCMHTVLLGTIDHAKCFLLHPIIDLVRVLLDALGTDKNAQWEFLYSAMKSLLSSRMLFDKCARLRSTLFNPLIRSKPGVAFLLTEKDLRDEYFRYLQIRANVNLIESLESVSQLDSIARLEILQALIPVMLLELQQGRKRPIREAHIFLEHMLDIAVRGNNLENIDPFLIAYVDMHYEFGIDRTQFSHNIEGKDQSVLGQMLLNRRSFEGENALIKQIGNGQFGSVYLSRKHTAVKLVDVSRQNCGSLNKTMQEISSMKKCRSNFVLPLLSFGRVGDTATNQNQILFIESPLYDMSLGKYVRESFSVCTPAKFVSLLLLYWQILSGVEHIHKMGIVHHDLKIDNLLVNLGAVTNTANTPHACAVPLVAIADFGEATTASDTHYTTQRGTESIQPPEVVLHSTALNSEIQHSTGIDIWSLGCLLFELIAGEPLFALSEEESGNWASFANTLSLDSEIPVLSEAAMSKISLRWHFLDERIFNFIRFILVKDFRDRPDITAVLVQFVNVFNSIVNNSPPLFSLPNTDGFTFVIPNSLPGVVYARTASFN